MRKFLEFVAGQLVDQPEAVTLREETRGDTTWYFLDLPAPEIGKVIGKQGHTVRAIRNLLEAAAARQGGHCAFEIIERELKAA